MSGGADHEIRVWKLKRKKLATSIPVPHPTDEELYQFKELIGDPKNTSTNHPINTPKEVKAVADCKKVTCYCFSKLEADQETRIISGYADGLICYWEEGEDNKYQMTPFIGHTNRINHIIHIPDTQYIFSVSNDCTMRQWALHTSLCERLFKFHDPLYYIHWYKHKNLLFTSSWDKQVRAIDVETGKV